MKKELEKQLIDQFPAFFVNMYGDMRNTCLWAGIETGDGWYNIIENLCHNLSLLHLSDFEFEQIKEKWGLLRIYYTSDGTDNVDKLVDLAEQESAKVCEVCGTKENVKMTDYGWFKTLCNECKTCNSK